MTRKARARIAKLRIERRALLAQIAIHNEAINRLAKVAGKLVRESARLHGV